jgi:hypothetical protein
LPPRSRAQTSIGAASGVHMVAASAFNPRTDSDLVRS